MSTQLQNMGSNGELSFLEHQAPWTTILTRHFCSFELHSALIYQEKFCTETLIITPRTKTQGKFLLHWHSLIFVSCLVILSHDVNVGFAAMFLGKKSPATLAQRSSLQNVRMHFIVEAGAVRVSWNRPCSKHLTIISYINACLQQDKSLIFSSGLSKVECVNTLNKYDPQNGANGPLWGF